MAYSRASDILTSYDKLIPPSRQDKDFLSKADENRLGEMKDKYINKVKQLSGIYNHFPSRVDRFIPEDLKRYGEMYFSTPEAEDIDLEVKIQNNFNNRRIEEQKEQLNQQQEANKIKMIQEAYQTGLRLPESGVNVFSPEGQAYLNSQATQKGVSYQELVANGKKAFNEAELKKQNDMLAEMISKKASLIVKAIKQGKDLEEVLIDEMNDLKRNLDNMFADLNPELRLHIELRAEEELKRNVIVRGIKERFRERREMGRMGEEEEEQRRIEEEEEEKRRRRIEEGERPLDATSGDIEDVKKLFGTAREIEKGKLFSKNQPRVDNKPIKFQFEGDEIDLIPLEFKSIASGNYILSALPSGGKNRVYFKINKSGGIVDRIGSKTVANSMR